MLEWHNKFLRDQLRIIQNFCKGNQFAHIHGIESRKPGQKIALNNAETCFIIRSTLITADHSIRLEKIEMRV